MLGASGMIVGSEKNWKQEDGGFVFALGVSCRCSGTVLYEMRSPVILQSAVPCLENQRAAVGAAFSTVLERSGTLAPPGNRDRD